MSYKPTHHQWIAEYHAAAREFSNERLHPGARINLANRCKRLARKIADRYGPATAENEHWRKQGEWWAGQANRKDLQCDHPTSTAPTS